MNVIPSFHLRYIDFFSQIVFSFSLDFIIIIIIYLFVLFIIIIILLSYLFIYLLPPCKERGIFSVVRLYLYSVLLVVWLDCIVPPPPSSLSTLFFSFCPLRSGPVIRCTFKIKMSYFQEEFYTCSLATMLV